MCTNRYTEVPAYVKKYQHITRYIYIYILFGIQKYTIY